MAENPNPTTIIFELVNEGCTSIRVAKRGHAALEFGRHSRHVPCVVTKACPTHTLSSIPLTNIFVPDVGAASCMRIASGAEACDNIVYKNILSTSWYKTYRTCA